MWWTVWVLHLYLLVFVSRCVFCRTYCRSIDSGCAELLGLVCFLLIGIIYCSLICSCGLVGGVLCAWPHVQHISNGAIASVYVFCWCVRTHTNFLTLSIYCISCLVSDRWMCHICGEWQMTSVLVDTLNTLHHRALHVKCVKCGV